MAHASEPGPDARRLLEMALEQLTAAETEATSSPSLEQVAQAFPELDVRRLVGRGGMASVFEVRDAKAGRAYALKVMHPHLSKDPEFAERFAREARTQETLDHPNIVTVHRHGEAGGLLYLLTDFVDGADLRRVMRTGGLGSSETLRLVAQVCDALRHAHERGVVHRDIKPENVLVDEEGHARVADFGLAKLVGKQADAYSLTRTGQALGTPHYMAPEQVADGDVDHRADVYALGVLLYEMLTGRLPLGRFSLPSEAIGADPSLDAIVIRALAEAVDQRYQKVGEMQGDLGKVPSADGSKASPRSGSSGLGTTGAALVGAALLFGLFLLVFTRSDEYLRDSAKQGVLPLLVAPWLLIGAVGSILGFVSARRIERSGGDASHLKLSLLAAWIPVVLVFDAAVLIPLSFLPEEILPVAVGVSVPILLVLNIGFLRTRLSGRS